MTLTEMVPSTNGHLSQGGATGRLDVRDIAPRGAG